MQEFPVFAIPNLSLGILKLTLMIVDADVANITGHCPVDEIGQSLEVWFLKSKNHSQMLRHLIQMFSVELDVFPRALSMFLQVGYRGELLELPQQVIPVEKCSFRCCKDEVQEKPSEFVQNTRGHCAIFSTTARSNTQLATEALQPLPCSINCPENVMKCEKNNK